VIARGVREGALAKGQADLDVWLFMGLLRGVLIRDLRGGIPCDESHANRVVDIFFDGAKA
jgi:hypothetical protein